VSVFRWVHRFTRVLIDAARPCPAEVSTDRAPSIPQVLDELLPSACHVVEQYVNDLIEAGHGWLRSRLRPILATETAGSVRVSSAGHALV
jgi:transposase, IS6 family